MKITVDDGSTVSTQKGLLCILQKPLGNENIHRSGFGKEQDEAY